MPRQISQARCSAHEQVIRELQTDYSERWSEFANVYQQFAAADGEHDAAYVAHTIAMVDWSDWQFLADKAEEALSRCRERRENDCAQELAELERHRAQLEAADLRANATRQRLEEAEDKLEMLTRQLEEIGEAIDRIGARAVQRENWMLNGHCYRFKTP